MNNMRPLQNTVKPISLSDSQKDALVTAMREAGTSTRQVEALRSEAAKPATDSRLAQSEELLFIL